MYEFFGVTITTPRRQSIMRRLTYVTRALGLGVHRVLRVQHLGLLAYKPSTEGLRSRLTYVIPAREQQQPVDFLLLDVLAITFRKLVAHTPHIASGSGFTPIPAK